MSPSIPISSTALRTPAQPRGARPAAVATTAVTLVIAAVAALVVAFPGSDTPRPASGRLAVPAHLSGVTRGGPVRAPFTRTDGQPRQAAAASLSVDHPASLSADHRTLPAAAPLAADHGTSGATERHHQGG